MEAQQIAWKRDSKAINMKVGDGYSEDGRAIIMKSIIFGITE
jgi:hypothetical protein